MVLLVVDGRPTRDNHAMAVGGSSPGPAAVRPRRVVDLVDAAALTAIVAVVRLRPHDGLQTSGLATPTVRGLVYGDTHERTDLPAGVPSAGGSKA